MRNAKSTFRCLYNDQGVKTVDGQQIKDMVLEFDQTLLGSCIQNQIITQAGLDQTIQFTIVAEKMNFLQKGVIGIESKETPNGYSSHLFKKHGMCFLKKLLKQLNPFSLQAGYLGKLMPPVSYWFISLQPLRNEYFRAISCFNII